jgi:hypothetical protein
MPSLVKAPSTFTTPRSPCSTACSPSQPATGRKPAPAVPPTGDTVSFVVNDEDGGTADGIRAFAGVRWDPFIMDAPATLKTIATGQLEFTDPGSMGRA